MELPKVEGGPARDVDSSQTGREVRQVEGRLSVPGRCRCGAGAGRSGRPELATSHPVVEVVYAYNVDVHVAAGSMQEVVAANGEQIAVAADDCDRKFRVREL